jgi:hypothetical protein
VLHGRLVLAELALPVDCQETRTDLYQIFESLTHEGDFPNRLRSDSPGKQFSEGFAIAASLPLRPEFDAALRRRPARQSRDPGQTRRCLARAEIYADGLRTETFAPIHRRWGRSQSAHRAIFKSRRSQWPIEHARAKLGDGPGIEQIDEATDRDADRNVALASVFCLAIRGLSA